MPEIEKGQPIPEQQKTEDKTVKSFPNIRNAPPGYDWTDRWNARKKIDAKIGWDPKSTSKPRTISPGVSPSDPHMQMENYDKLNSVERWMGTSMPTGMQKAKEKLDAFLPGNIEKGVYAVGNWVIKAMSIFDAAGEFVERGSGFVRQWKLAAENDDLDNFRNNIGDAWAAGSMFYDVSNAPMFQDGKLIFHTDLPSTSELPVLRKKITTLTDQGVGRRAALEQVRTEYMQDLGALSIRAAKQDMLGHVLIDPFMWLTLGGYAPVDIIKGVAVTARGSKYAVGYLDELADMAKIAENAGDIKKAAECISAIADIKKTMKPITAWDKAAMFLTGDFPEPIGAVSKLEKTLYYFGNTLAQSETTGGKIWRKINPFSLTPEARWSEWSTRIDDYLSTHVLSSNDPYKIIDDLTTLASQATSGRIAAIAATADGRMIQSYLRAAEISGQELLNDFRTVADDGALLIRIAEKLKLKSPDLIDNILAGKGDDIIKQLSSLDDEGLELASLLTKDKLELLGLLKGKPYTEELCTHILRNAILDDMARVGIVKFGIEAKGLLYKWSAFMKAGETMAFLRMNPTFAAKNWFNNEFTLIRDFSGGGFFTRTEDLIKLADKLNFTPLRASQAWTMAGMTGDTLGDIGAKASQTIAKQLQGDAIFLDKWARKINNADLGIFDFGKLAQRVERSASQRAMVKGYTRAWRKFWKPGGFTSASKFLPQEIIRELGPEAVKRIDNVLQDASSMDDIDRIFSSLATVDLNASASGVINNVEQKLGIDLGTQFEELEVEMIRNSISKAIASGNPRKAEKVFDDLFETTIQKITKEADEALSAKLQKFEQATEAGRSMALLDVTEELTNQLDIANYTYSVGMARFRPMDVSKEVRDAYWPIWLKQQNAHFDNVYKRIDAAIDGVRKGGQNIDLNLDQALKTFDTQKKTWSNFFEKRNGLYEASKEAGWENWDEIVEEIDRLYIIASDTDLAIIKRTDDLMTEVIRKNNPELAEGFAGWRRAIREWKLKDRAQTRSYTYAQKTGTLGVDAPTYSGFWRERGALHEELGSIKQRGYAMMEGDQNELARFAGMAHTRSPEELIESIKKIGKYDSVADEIVIDGVTKLKVSPTTYDGNPAITVSIESIEKGKGNAKKTLDTLEELADEHGVYLIGNVEQFGDTGMTTEQLLDWYRRRGYTVIEREILPEVVYAPKVGRGVNQSLAKKLANDLKGRQTTMRLEQAMGSELGPMFMNEAREEQWFSRNFFTLRELEEETISTMRNPTSRLDDISDVAKTELNKYFNNAKREMADAQYGSLRMAEYTRDAALLNYNRKMNYDTWLGTFMPYEFWMTHSMGQWAVQSLNRPAMLAFYNRIRTMQDRIGVDDASYPTRLKGKMKIHIPGLPDWMGDNIYIDPLNIALPLGTMSMPYQMIKQKALSREGAVERELNKMVQNGDITQEEAREALRSQSGPLFQQALSASEGSDEQTDNWQLLSALSSPHAPYDIAYKALSGQPENIGPFLPATYTVTRLLGVFGVDLPHEKANAAARLRRRVGLPGFDQWEDYRVERMLANLSATGDITPDQAARAMIEHEGPAWELARNRAAKEYAGGTWWAALLKTLGAPTYIFPEGEYLQRQLGEQFSTAMEAYNKGDYEAYNKFFDKNPEFANRLSLWDTPAERMRNFLVDNVWNIYSELSTLDKGIVRDTLGDEFVMRFMDKETRNYEAIPIEQLQMWLKMMGGDPPGTLTEAFPIDFAPPEVANQAQIFYDVRNENFADYYELQSKYFDLAEGQARKDYLRKYPQLKEYWDWRRNFLKRNPSIAAYIDDSFEPKYASVQEMEQAYQNEPTFTKYELTRYVGSAGISILTDVYNQGFIPPPDIVEYLTEKAGSLGMTYEELVAKAGQAP